MKYTAAFTASGLQLPGQFLINAKQQSKKVGVLQQGVAHLRGL